MQRVPRACARLLAILISAYVHWPRHAHVRARVHHHEIRAYIYTCAYMYLYMHIYVCAHICVRVLIITHYSYNIIMNYYVYKFYVAI